MKRIILCNAETLRVLTIGQASDILATNEHTLDRCIARSQRHAAWRGGR